MRIRVVLGMVLALALVINLGLVQEAQAVCKVYINRDTGCSGVGITNSNLSEADFQAKSDYLQQCAGDNFWYTDKLQGGHGAIALAWPAGGNKPPAFGVAIGFKTRNDADKWALKQCMRLALDMGYQRYGGVRPKVVRRWLDPNGVSAEVINDRSQPLDVWPGNFTLEDLRSREP